MTRDALLARPFRTVPAPAPTPAAPKDGIVDLPPGKIAAIATYLEMRGPPASLPPFAGRLERLSGDLARYRALYARIGEPWLWFTRAAMSDTALRRILDDPSVEAWILVEGGRDAALVELDFRRAGECEIVFFGLAPEWCGKGLGVPLLGEALRRAFARPVDRVWLHTCTLDHPAAIRTYLRAGFTPYRRAIEVADDPRLAGYLPASAAPLFPSL
jgi:GNAT superfamily N-acetyltransferase